MDEFAIALLDAYTFEFPDQHDFPVNCATYGQGVLASELLTALARLSKASGHLRYGTVKGRDTAIRVFVRDVQSHRPEVISVSDIVPADLDHWEGTLAKRYPTGRTALTYLSGTLGLLSECATFLDLREDTKYRLNLPSTHLPTEAVPREVYDTTELAAIKALALRSRQNTLIRLVTDKVNVDTLGGDEQEVLRMALAGEGAPKKGTTLRTRLDMAKKTPASLPLLVVPGSADLLGIIVLLAMETGWNPSTILDLEADCLVNPSPGKVGVKTFKPRRGERAHEVIYVRDSGPLTVGGLLRSAIAITQPLRQATGKPDLWLWWSPRYGGVYAKQSLLAKQKVRAFVAENGATLGEDGLPDLQLVRIRKSVKAKEYKDSLGDLRSMVGHSPTVAARHYANLPSAADEHLGAIRNALADVLEMASTSRMDALPTEQDTLTTACADVKHSPYAPAGSACSADPSMCFGCPNSVISLRHLPRILVHVDQLSQAAQSIPPEEWVAAHGATWLRIHESILPQFTDQEITGARTQVPVRTHLPFHVKGSIR